MIQHRLEEQNCPDRLEDEPWSATISRGLKIDRSFESIRMGIKDVSARWLKASKVLKKEVPDLWPEAGRDGQEAFQRGILRPRRSLGGSSVISAVGIGEGDGQC